MKRRERRRRAPGGLTPRAKVWLETQGRYAFGLGLSEILKAVDALGSIKAAAVQLGKSYRYVWARIKHAEKTLQAPLVETRIGGRGTRRSMLTPQARRLVADFDWLRQRILDILRDEFSTRF